MRGVATVIMYPGREISGYGNGKHFSYHTV